MPATPASIPRNSRVMLPFCEPEWLSNSLAGLPSSVLVDSHFGLAAQYTYIRFSWTRSSLLRLLSEKCKRRSEPLNPWSCGLGHFRRFAAIVGNGIPSPGITETRLKTSFSQKDGFGCVVGSKSVREAERPAGPVTPY